MDLPFFLTKHHETSLSTGKVRQNECYNFTLPATSTQRSQLSNLSRKTSE
ncbi:hypothetical protein HMPREF9056_02935 [Actinomyces sp. oral taxon 170 str. F0386]|nr:hypothetical protein HMPREF9056_02935 [Actinomyces sp. oral taxon 170 str. F0386]